MNDAIFCSLHYAHLLNILNKNAPVWDWKGFVNIQAFGDVDYWDTCLISTCLHLNWLYLQMILRIYIYVYLSDIDQIGCQPGCQVYYSTGTLTLTEAVPLLSIAACCKMCPNLTP